MMAALRDGCATILLADETMVVSTMRERPEPVLPSCPSRSPHRRSSTSCRPSMPDASSCALDGRGRVRAGAERSSADGATHGFLQQLARLRLPDFP